MVRNRLEPGQGRRPGVGNLGIQPCSQIRIDVVREGLEWYVNAGLLLAEVASSMFWGLPWTAPTVHAPPTILTMDESEAPICTMDDKNTKQ